MQQEVLMVRSRKAARLEAKAATKRVAAANLLAFRPDERRASVAGR